MQLPGNGVDSLAFSPNGELSWPRRWETAIPVREVITSVRLLDARDGETLRTLTGHTDGVLAVRFAPDGRRLVSGGL